MRVAVIFAGGKSSRMGKDKALLEFGGKSLTKYQYDKFSKIFDKVYISTKENKFNFDAEFIYDEGETFSPAVALQSVLKNAPTDAVFVLSVDVPFIKEEYIYTLYSGLNSYDAVVAKTQTGLQPMCAIYTQKVLPKLEQMIMADNHKLNFLLNQCNTNTIYFEDEESFLNLNHPHEYELALTKAKSFK